MWRGCLLSLIGFIAFQLLDSAFGRELYSILRTTALTIFYHLAVRLALGEWMVDRFKAECFDYERPWFQVGAREASLYRRLGVHRWKGGVPTYSPEEFSIEKHSLEEIARATCRAEVVHEFNAAVSFVPLLFAIPFGAFPVFLLTSMAAAAFDLIFVLVQRYNRPRLVRLMQMQEKRRRN